MFVACGLSRSSTGRMDSSAAEIDARRVSSEDRFECRVASVPPSDGPGDMIQRPLPLSDSFASGEHRLRRYGTELNARHGSKPQVCAVIRTAPGSPVFRTPIECAKQLRRASTTSASRHRTRISACTTLAPHPLLPPTAAGSGH